MSDHIPFEIQSEIMKRLPVKSLIQFRSVSKQWKSFIDSPKFIKNYHVNHTNPQHHLLVRYKLDTTTTTTTTDPIPPGQGMGEVECRQILPLPHGKPWSRETASKETSGKCTCVCERARYKLDTVETYTSIVDDNTFPLQKFSLTAPKSLSLLREESMVDGLLCFCDFYGDLDLSNRMAVIWNPTVRKSVGIVIPKPKTGYNFIGFGVCPDTSDPKLVKITVDKITASMWVVEVFTLSTRVWKTVYTGAPFKSWVQVFVNGVIYFLAFEDHGVGPNFVISFDLKSEKFGEVCLPEGLVHTPVLNVAKVNESLGLLEYYDEDYVTVCGVWTRKDGANKPFTKIYTIKVGGTDFYNRVLGFRNNGEAVMELMDDDNYNESRIEAYDPSSGHINGVGINGELRTFYTRSYTETLLLLDQSDSIIL